MELIFHFKCTLNCHLKFVSISDKSKILLSGNGLNPLFTEHGTYLFHTFISSFLPSYIFQVRQPDTVTLDEYGRLLVTSEGNVGQACIILDQPSADILCKSLNLG